MALLDCMMESCSKLKERSSAVKDFKRRQQARDEGGW